MKLHPFSHACLEFWGPIPLKGTCSPRLEVHLLVCTCLGRASVMELHRMGAREGSHAPDSPYSPDIWNISLIESPFSKSLRSILVNFR
jgi:hypothetical protein